MRTCKQSHNPSHLATQGTHLDSQGTPLDSQGTHLPRSLINTNQISYTKESIQSTRENKNQKPKPHPSAITKQNLYKSPYTQCPPPALQARFSGHTRDIHRTICNKPPKYKNPETTHTPGNMWTAHTQHKSEHETTNLNTSSENTYNTQVEMRNSIFSRATLSPTRRHRTP